MASTNKQEFIKLVLIGDSGVGKTSFLKRFVDNKFWSEPTIGAALRTKQVQSKDGHKEINLNLWDSAGRERFAAQVRAWFRGAQGAILCFDLTDRQSFIQTNKWLQQINDNAPNARIILVGTKSDLADRRQVSTEEAKEFAQHAGIPFIETSAKSNINVEEAINILVDMIESAPPLPPKQALVSSSPAPSRRSCVIM